MDEDKNTELETILSEVVRDFLVPHFLELGMRATGEWEDSLVVSGNELWGAHYTEQLVHGLGPGYWVPIGALKKWSQAKFGHTDYVYAIQRKIYNEGTSWYQKGGSDLLEVLESDDVKGAIERKYKKHLEVTLQDDLTRYLNQSFAQ